MSALRGGLPIDSTAMGFLARLGLLARRGFGRVVPEPFVIAIAITMVVLAAAVGSGYDPLDTVATWGEPKGLWSLLGFAMQMSVMLVFGSALAESPPVRGTLVRLVAIARTPRQLVGLTAFVAAALGVLNWSLGLIGGALLAREGGRVAQQAGWRLHYPILCAAGYSGLMVWHGGLSGSAPLKATTIEDLAEVLGPALAAEVGPIPLQASLFGTLNLWVTGGLVLLAPLLFVAMTPKTDPDPILAAAVPQLEPGPDASPPPETIIDRIERSPVVGWSLAMVLAGGVAIHLVRHGAGSIDFNTVNMVLWALALAAHGRPDRFLQACERGVVSCAGVIVQFPLYAGVMAVMNDSGLSARLSTLAASAGPDLLAPVTFLGAGVINLFVPSGGGQWAVQGPILARAGLDAGVPVEDLMMAMAYGDQWSNMIQPFWALPLLAITGVRARDIVGYCSIWMVGGGVWIVLQLLLHV